MTGSDVQTGTHRCAMCGERKARSHFGRQKDTRSGLGSYCLECRRKYRTKTHSDCGPDTIIAKARSAADKGEIARRIPIYAERAAANVPLFKESE